MEKELEKMLTDIYNILKEFDYEEDEDSCMGMSFFKARINEDWFFHNLWKLEEYLNKCKKN